eukprot:TRINITY_DN3495_c0_g1_i1.p1 TRINITY_DN3495_c0_g1~~TRINITY_DN3495_c0_g1_i1.p1  ORF type:complete len:538 (-),score=107.37 TRINITY_DN3495_c0_g1_i1:266-1879(-)
MTLLGGIGMVEKGAAVLLLAVAGVNGQVPTYTAQGVWPGANASASNAAWPVPGHEPTRLEAWPKNPDGSAGKCWQTSVLFDTKTGWPGLCSNLFKVDAITNQESCRATCASDPRCPVWQFDGGGHCKMGFGIHCAPKSKAVGASQRLMHGSIRVLKAMIGIRVRNLYKIGIEPGGVDVAANVQRCKGWCYSVISCNYWQYSNKDGCFVDAPMLSTKGGKNLANQVPYPLTTADTATAADMIAGEYIQHYCPPAVAPPTAKKKPAGLPIWAWIAGGVVLVVVLACCGYCCCLPSEGSRSKRHEEQSEDESGSEGEQLLSRSVEMQETSEMEDLTMPSSPAMLAARDRAASLHQSLLEDGSQASERSRQSGEQVQGSGEQIQGSGQLLDTPRLGVNVTLPPQQQFATKTPQQQFGATMPEQQQQFGATLQPQQQSGATMTPQQQQFGATLQPQQQLGSTMTPQQQQLGATLQPQQQLGSTMTPQQQQLGMTMPAQQQFAAAGPSQLLPAPSAAAAPQVMPYQGQGQPMPPYAAGPGFPR